MDIFHDVQACLQFLFFPEEMPVAVCPPFYTFTFQSIENTSPSNVGQPSLFPFGLHFAVIS